MTGTVSALYFGAVTHRRFAPKPHRLRYGMFQLLLDVDEVQGLGRRLKLFSHNRFNVFSHHDRDHGDGGEGCLRDYVENTLRAAGMPLMGGRIELLCMPRLFGHVFNPLSIYYCRRADGSLAAMLYEVNNTFGQRHSYLIQTEAGAGDVVRQSCAKNFHVSPFMDMAMTYEFEVTSAGETIATTINGRDLAGDIILAAAFTGRRTPLTDGALIRALLGFPLLTLKVVAAIHVEAVKLWLKGVRLRPLPPAPEHAITFVTAGGL